MALRDLILKNRSYRRFDETVPMSVKLLSEWVDLARLTSSAKNMQPLRYILSCEKNMNARIFETLSWAGYLTEWEGPVKDERPTGYIVILRDNSITDNNYCDHGLAAQSIMLGATEKGFGGCIIAAINRKKLASILNLPENLEILLVLALGKPKETVILDVLENNESHKYWRDNTNNQHVPKRKLEDIILTRFG